jgi:hypothetical protein
MSGSGNRRDHGGPNHEQNDGRCALADPELLAMDGLYAELWREQEAATEAFDQDGA